MALDKIPGVRYGSMEYLRLEDVEKFTKVDVNRLPFLKRVGFAAEEEYRIIVETQEPQKPAVNIEFDIRWINRIYLNPWLPKPIAESVIKVLKTLPGCGKLKVYRSQLINSSRWKRAGDKIVGKPMPTAKGIISLPPSVKRASAKKLPSKNPKSP